MWRATLLLTLGILCAALLCSAAAVYVFHDVDLGKASHLNEAFVGLCIESLFFALIIGVAVGIVVLLIRALTQLRSAPINPRLGLYLGIGITLLQYPSEFAVRKLLPKVPDAFLLNYIAAAILICIAAFVFDNLQQLKANC